MIYVTGDTHIPIDIEKLNSKNFPEGKDLTKDDYVIICGDFGLVWNYKETGICVPSNPDDKHWTPEEIHWKEWLEEKPWTTLFIDGNHENFDRLNSYQVETWNGGKIHKISDSIIHLMRGQVFTIEGKTFFTFGGARSHDRGIATQSETYDRGIIWWDEEMPTLDEMNEGRKNLEIYDNNIDYIITHEIPTKDLVGLGLKNRRWYHSNYLNTFFEDIRINSTFTHWYAGHYHIDMSTAPKHTILYQNIIRIGEDHVH